MSHFSKDLILKVQSIPAGQPTQRASISMLKFKWK